MHTCNSGQEENGTQTLFESSEDLDVSRNLREHVLWVDKYSPKLFTELLSDDVSLYINMSMLLIIILVSIITGHKSHFVVMVTSLG